MTFNLPLPLYRFISCKASLWLHGFSDLQHTLLHTPSTPQPVWCRGQLHHYPGPVPCSCPRPCPHQHLHVWPEHRHHGCPSSEGLPFRTADARDPSRAFGHPGPTLHVQLGRQHGRSLFRLRSDVFIYSSSCRYAGHSSRRGQTLEGVGVRWSQQYTWADLRGCRGTLVCRCADWYSVLGHACAQNLHGVNIPGVVILGRVTVKLVCMSPVLLVYQSLCRTSRWLSLCTQNLDFSNDDLLNFSFPSLFSSSPPAFCV